MWIRRGHLHANIYKLYQNLEASKLNMLEHVYMVFFIFYKSFFFYILSYHFIQCYNMLHEFNCGALHVFTFELKPFITFYIIYTILQRDIISKLLQCPQRRILKTAAPPTMKGRQAISSTGQSTTAFARETTRPCRYSGMRMRQLHFAQYCQSAPLNFDRSDWRSSTVEHAQED